ncbi:polyphenol oxidase family protein, partial [Corynebacterium nasicanis]
MSLSSANEAPRPVRMVFTSRAGGVSSSPYDSFNLGDHVGDDPAAVAENRARLARVLDLEHVVWMEQIHSHTVTVVDGPQPGPVEATDALVTTQRGLALAVLVADCVPVLLADHTNGVVAA